MVYSSAAVFTVIFLFFVPLYHHCYVMNTRMHKARSSSGGTSLAKYFDNITEEAAWWALVQKRASPFFLEFFARNIII